MASTNEDSPHAADEVPKDIEMPDMEQSGPKAPTEPESAAVTECDKKSEVPRTPKARTRPAAPNPRSLQISKSPKTPRTPTATAKKFTVVDKIQTGGEASPRSARYARNISSPTVSIMAGPRPKKRHLVRWNDCMDRKLLLAIQQVCNAEGVTVPWDKIGSVMGEHVTGGAVIQHLSKLRTRAISAKEAVPPPLRRGGVGAGVRPTSSSAPTTPKTPRRADSKPTTPKIGKKRAKTYSDEEDSDDEDYGDDSDGEYGAPNAKRGKASTKVGKIVRVEAVEEEGGEAPSGKETGSRDTELIKVEIEDTAASGEDQFVGAGAAFTKFASDIDSDSAETIEREKDQQVDSDSTEQSKLVILKLQPDHLSMFDQAETVTAKAISFPVNPGGFEAEREALYRTGGMSLVAPERTSYGRDAYVSAFGQQYHHGMPQIIQSYGNGSGIIGHAAQLYPSNIRNDFNVSTGFDSNDHLSPMNQFNFNNELPNTYGINNLMNASGSGRGGGSYPALSITNGQGFDSHPGGINELGFLPGPNATLSMGYRQDVDYTGVNSMAIQQPLGPLVTTLSNSTLSTLNTPTTFSNTALETDLNPGAHQAEHDSFDLMGAQFGGGQNTVIADQVFEDFD